MKMATIIHSVCSQLVQLQVSRRCCSSIPSNNRIKPKLSKPYLRRYTGCIACYTGRCHQNTFAGGRTSRSNHVHGRYRCIRQNYARRGSACLLERNNGPCIPFVATIRCYTGHLRIVAASILRRFRWFASNWFGCEKRFAHSRYRENQIQCRSYWRLSGCCAIAERHRNQIRPQLPAIRFDHPIEGHTVITY